MENIDLHPIQLESIAIKKLSIDVWDMNQAINYKGDLSLQIQNGHGEFNPEDSSINVAVRANLGTPIPDESQKYIESAPFYIEVELFGLFIVDTKQFDVKHLPQWAKVNAPFLLMPYLREHLYGLSARANIQDIIIPLFVQPPVW